MTVGFPYTEHQPITYHERFSPPSDRPIRCEGWLASTPEYTHTHTHWHKLNPKSKSLNQHGISDCDKHKAALSLSLPVLSKAQHS